MLYLNPPYYLYNNVCFFPDHLDKELFYFLRTVPRLSFRDGNIPQFHLYQFVSETEGGTAGGLLDFQVDMGVTDNEQKELAQGLKSLVNSASGKDPIKSVKLAPVPLSDGKVQLIMLGATSGAQSAGQDSFVTRILQAPSPSLYGDNRAIFSVRLDKEGSTLLKKVIAGEMSPIGVVYSLSFPGLKPAYKFKIEANWNEISKAFAEQTKVNAIFYKKDIQNSWSTFEQQKIIKIESDTYVTKDEAPDAITQKDKLLEQLTDMAINKFFEPKLPDKKESGGGDALGGLGSLIQSVTGIFSGNIGYGYSSSRAESESKKSLTAEVQERVTITQRATPQAFLSTLAATIGKAADIQKYIQQIRLGDDFYKYKKVEVAIDPDLKAKSIASVDVKLTYGAATPRNITFTDKGKAPAPTPWNAELDSAGKMLDEVTGEATFKILPPESMRKFPSEIKHTYKSSSNVLSINPWEAFTVRKVVISARGDFPWSRYSTINVQVQYEDKANGCLFDQPLGLTQAKPSGEANLFIVDQTKQAYRYKVTLTGENTPERVFDWKTSELGQIEIPPPRMYPITLNADDDFFNAIKTVKVTLVYKDAANGVNVTELRSLNAKNKEDEAQNRVLIPIVDPNVKEVAYDLRVTTLAGKSYSVNGSRTREDTIDLVTVGDDNIVAGRRYVDVVPDKGRWPSYSKIVAKVEHIDTVLDAIPEIKKVNSKLFTFTKDSRAANTWEYSFSKEGGPKVRYQIRYYNDEGYISERLPANSNDYLELETDKTELVIPLTPST